MTQKEARSRFEASIRRPDRPADGTSWAFVVLPKDVSAVLPRRGRTTVAGTINGHRFNAFLEPDGQNSHWLRIEEELLKASGACVGDVAQFEIAPVEQEPEPELPADFLAALEASPDASTTWNETTPVARVDWIHWIDSAKQTKTRTKRINDACDMLAAGKRRVCCFDPSGYYSNAFRAPKAVDS